MPTRTFRFVNLAGGQIIGEYDVNDANWRVSQVRCINNSAHGAYIRVLEDGVEVFSQTAPANQTTSWNTSGLQLGWQPDEWNEQDQQWEPGGIELFGYQICLRWPA